LPSTFTGPRANNSRHDRIRRIAVNDFDTRKTFAQEIHHASILLDQQRVARTSEREFRQCAESRAELHPRLIRLQVKLRDNPFGEILIV
jgi:hypothetical protein